MISKSARMKEEKEDASKKKWRVDSGGASSTGALWRRRRVMAKGARIQCSCSETSVGDGVKLRLLEGRGETYVGRAIVDEASIVNWAVPSLLPLRLNYCEQGGTRRVVEGAP